ncbi:ABC transporter ATP-binding protein [Sphingomonas koreensis]|nr:ABC transporter ATP-binding protein [Sphingomonas koreensis]
MSIAIDRLRVERGAAVVVDEATLRIEAGAWFGVIGANGSGKTSLLRALAGRLPIVSGACVIDGISCAEDRAVRAQMIGFAPSIETLPGALLARDLLEIVAGRSDDALVSIGPLRVALAIDRLLDRPIGTCSAGMRQRIALACAFADGKRIVVLDEPFNWLDPVAAYDVRMALRVMADDGLTLVTALHDLTTMGMACDAAALLSSGRVALGIDAAMIAEARRDPATFEHRTIALLRGG